MFFVEMCVEDASGNADLAAVFGSWCFAESWPSYLKEYQIAIKELFPIVVALELWGKHLQNSKVMSLDAVNQGANCRAF
jgi:hypothetical protein